MSDETIIIQPERFFFRISGRRLTALPDTGTIATIEKTAPDATVVGGLFRTASMVINGSDIHTATVNVKALSRDDQYMQAARKAIRSLGQLVTVSVEYQGGSLWQCGGAVILGDPTRNVIADGTEFLAYQLQGIFAVEVAAFVNPDPLTEDQISAG